MTRRITCYVVFVTLLWGAHTEKEERFQDLFKSNMTRNGFSNLLSSLIKLNKQRVNVLQKLHRLEDYGVLSEVLRSGDKKLVNGNPSNLFLVVMSKNPTDSSHRNSGYQLVDLVTSLEVAGSNNIPKLDYVLDPASFVFQNDRKENTLTKLFANTPRVYKQKKRHLIGVRIIKNTTTNKPVQYRTTKQIRKHLINLLMTPKDTLHAKEPRMIELVSKNKSSNASKRLLYSSTVAINDQSTRYKKIELTIKKYKLTTKPITIKDIILRSKRKKPKYNLEDKVEKDEHYNGSPFNISFKNNDNDLIKNTTQINGDMFTKLFLDNSKVPKKEKKVFADSDFSYENDNAYNSDSKVNDISFKKIDDNNHPETGKGKVISKLTRISVKKFDDNNHLKTGTDKVVSKENVTAAKKVDDNHNSRIGTHKAKVTDISVKKIDDNNHPKPGTDKVFCKENVIAAKKVDDNNHPRIGTNKLISKVTDISVKKIDDNIHPKPGTNKVISKVTVISVVKIDDNNHPKPGTDKVISKVTDISVKKIDDNNHPKSGTDKVVPKINVIAAKNIDDNNHHRIGTDKVISKVTDISVKKIDDNNHPKPETHQNTLKTKVQGNQHTKLIRNKSSLLWSDNQKSRIETDRRTTVLKNPDQIINGTVGSDNASASNHTVFNISPILNPNLNINEDDAYADDFMANIRRTNATKETDHGNGFPLITSDNTLSVAASNILAPLTFTKTTKNKNNLDSLWNPNNAEDNSYNDKMKTNKDLHNGDRHNDVEPKKNEDYDNDENKNYGKKSNEVFTLIVTDEGKGKAERMKVLQDLQLAQNGFDQPETKPIARGTFQTCLNKKARKLCYKSCKSAYRNVCRRMKCTSRSKRALKRECKRSCQKTFKSGKYSYEDSDDSRSKSGSYESDDSD